MEIKYYSNRTDLLKAVNEQKKLLPFADDEHISHDCGHENCFAIELVDFTTYDRLGLFVECGECELEKE